MIRFLLGVLLGVIIGASIATRLPNIEFDYFERKADQIIEDKIQQQTEDIKKQIKNEKEKSKNKVKDFLDNI
jgi:gas vesicle protein